MLKPALAASPRILIIGLLLLATVVAGLRLGTPLLDGLRSPLERLLSQQSGQQVTVGALQVRWRILSPRITVSDVRIHDAAGEGPMLAVDHLDLGLAPWRSLQQGRLVLGHLQVRGADLHLLRDDSGRVRVRGAEGLPTRRDDTTEALPVDLLALAVGRAFTLSESRLRWEDRQLGMDYQFDDLNLDIAVEAGQVRLAGDVFLPATLGHSFRLGMNLHHGGQWDDWSGDTFIEADGLNLAGLPEEIRATLGLDRGQLDGQVWLHWQQGEPHRAYLALTVQQLTMTPVPEPGLPTPELETLAGKLLWQARPGGWDLRVDELVVSRQGDPWPPGGLDLSVVAVDEGTQVNVWLDYLRLEDLLPLVLHQPWLRQTLQPGLPTLVELAPRGILTATRLGLVIPDDGEPRFVADGRFQGGAVAPWGPGPGVSGAAGAFSFAETGGELWLDSTALEVSWPDQFPHKLPIDTLQGRVRWLPAPDGHRLALEELVLANADLQLGGQGVIHLGADPEMDLQLVLVDGDGARTSRYLPQGFMPELSRQWLDQAIVDGRITQARLLFRGRFDDFPFRHHEGVFQVMAKVEDGVLDYEPGWPRLEAVSATVMFHNQGLRIDEIQAQVFGAHIDAAQAWIMDLQAPVLGIQGHIRGPLEDYLRFVTASPLAEAQESLLAGISVQGEAGLDIGLHIPLADRDTLTQPDRVRGRLTFMDNQLALADPPLVLEALQGTVEFTEEAALADQLAARFNGAHVTARFHRAPSGALEVHAQGQQPITGLLAPVAPASWLDWLDGSAHWQAQLQVPAAGWSQGLLTLNSDLVGVRSSLPPPLAKIPEAARPLTVRFPLTPTPETPARITLGDHLSLLFTLDSAGALHRGELRLGGQEAVLPEQGWRIRGHLSGLSLDDWRMVFDTLDRSPPADTASQPGALDLHLDRLQFMGRRIDDISLQARREAGQWEAQVASPLMLGRIHWPHQTDAELVVDLEWLDLDQLSGQMAHTAAEPVRPDPASLPPLRLSAQWLMLRSQHFRGLQMNTQTIPGGVQLQRLVLADATGQARGEARGHWIKDDDDAHDTRLQIDLSSDDLGQTLALLGIQPVFRGGHAQLQAALQWPDTPTQVSWAGLTGTGRVQVDEGRLSEVQPGAGRLLGLFSLDLLPRRLALDFRDIFQRGFVFDRLQGHVQLQDGHLYTTDLTVHSPAARVRIQGRTGMVTRDYDQTITVTPSVKGTLPLAGALLGGPVTGLAVFVFDRMLGVGERIDEAARMEYRVTGDWAAPRVEAVARAAQSRAP